MFLTSFFPAKGWDPKAWKRNKMKKKSLTVELHLSGRWLTGSARLGSSGIYVENSTKLTCLEITGYRIKYSTVFWLLKLRIRRGWMVETQLLTVNSNSRTSNYQCCLFSKTNPIIWIFCISGWIAVSFNPAERSSSVQLIHYMATERNTIPGHWRKEILKKKKGVGELSYLPKYYFSRQ